MIKAIILDYGEVICYGQGIKNLARNCAIKLGIATEPFVDFMVTQWKLARINTITSSQFWRNLSRYFGRDAESIRNEFVRPSKVSDSVVDLLRKLKNNYKIGLLSNHLKDWLEENIEVNGLRKLFDAVVTSYNTGLIKPQVKIYLIIADKLEVKPEECVFVDDKRKNVEGAIKVGMKGIHFKNINQLETDLKKLGVNF